MQQQIGSPYRQLIKVMVVNSDTVTKVWSVGREGEVTEHAGLTIQVLMLFLFGTRSSIFKQAPATTSCSRPAAQGHPRSLRDHLHLMLCKVVDIARPAWHGRRAGYVWSCSGRTAHEQSMFHHTRFRGHVNAAFTSRILSSLNPRPKMVIYFSQLQVARR